MINVTASKLVSLALCTQCAWHQDKDKRFSGKHKIKPAAAVCKKCSGLTISILGRYIYEPYSRLFGFLKGQRVRGYTSNHHDRCGL